MDEAPKYRKKKSQKSKASNRADHKHQYEKTISVKFNSISGEINGYFWTTHCSICGRLGDFNMNNDDFRKPEYVGKPLFWSKDMFLSLEEIRKKYPDIPMYQSDPEDFGKETRFL